MPRIIALLLLMTVSTLTAQADRILETVRDPANPSAQTAAYNGRAIIAGNTDIYLLRYNDETFAQVNYPVLGGSQLKFNTSKNPLTQFESSLFFALASSTGSSRYLYRYSGLATFTRIVIPGNIIANTIVYGSHLYFLSDVSGITRLYRYSAGTVTEMTTAAIPRASGYELWVAGGNLYITGYASASGTVNFIRRYNGTSFFTLPWSGSGTNVSGIYAIPGTSRVYFSSHERILYYNGTTVTQVFMNTGEANFPVVWGTNLYFTTGVGALPGRTNHLYRLSGATLTHITLPAGSGVAGVPHTTAEVFGGFLYIAGVYTDGSTRLLRYNGTTFTPVFTIAIPFAGSGVRLSIRDGKLLIHPNFANGTTAYEYDGTNFEPIIAPAGRLLFPYINVGTACNYLWLNYYSDATGIHWAYAKESRGCPPPAAPVIVVPDHIMNYERFEMGVYGPGRGWCWNEIIIDWDIVPVCPVQPCPPPNYLIRLTDANNGVAWSQQFNQPSAFTVPLPDQQPFRTVLTSLDAQKELFRFEPELLPMGIETITVNIKPKQNYFLLAAGTRNNAQVPLKVTLLSATNKVLWEQTFTAPMSQQITATVLEPGRTLVFSVPGQGSKLITRVNDPCADNTTAVKQGNE